MGTRGRQWRLGLGTSLVPIDLMSMSRVNTIRAHPKAHDHANQASTRWTAGSHHSGADSKTPGEPAAHMKTSPGGEARAGVGGCVSQEGRARPIAAGRAAFKKDGR